MTTLFTYFKTAIDHRLYLSLNYISYTRPRPDFRPKICFEIYVNIDLSRYFATPLSWGNGYGWLMNLNMYY